LWHAKGARRSVEAPAPRRALAKRQRLCADATRIVEAVVQYRHSQTPRMRMENAVADRWLQGQAVALVLVLAGPAASAMGGHFDVDDATVLAPGRCQVELWTVQGESAHLAHLGPACRVGPVEVGINLERLSGGELSQRIAGIQLKAVTSWLQDVSVGLVGAASRDTTKGVSLLTAYVPVTWSLSGTFQVDFNLGIDRFSDRGRTPRLGIAGEWAIDQRFALLAERFHAFEMALTRCGVRIALGEHANIDLSAARVSNTGNRLWGLGLTFEFGR
jgi:hypothetical protein